jgi:hypothetical protein
MGLFSTKYDFHSHDNSTHIKYPDTVNVHEHKAPTDASVKLMEEMHDKAIKNIIAKVKVEDNLVNGECFLIEQPWNMNDVKLIFKFKINGQEFTIEKELARFEMGGDEQKKISDLSIKLESHAKAVMLWYALRMFTGVAYEKITNQEFPKELLR